MSNALTKVVDDTLTRLNHAAKGQPWKDHLSAKGIDPKEYISAMSEHNAMLKEAIQQKVAHLARGADVGKVAGGGRDATHVASSSVPTSGGHRR